MRVIERPKGLSLLTRGIRRRVLRPLKVLGPRNAAAYFFARTIRGPDAAFRALSRVICMNYRGQRFWLDLEDDMGAAEPFRCAGVAEPVSGVWEVFLADVYLRNMNVDLGRLRTVVDLGGNRGYFSVLASRFANRVLYVEANPAFLPTLHRNMALNKCTNIESDICFVGAGGFFENQFLSAPRKDISTLMRDHAIDRIDLLKMDIEGSEFQLLAVDDAALNKVSYIAAELHPECGDVNALMRALEVAGFSVTLEQGIYLNAVNTRAASSRRYLSA